MVDYCKNPLQNIPANSGVKIFDEKEKVRKNKDKEEKNEKSKKSPKDENIKKFIVEKDKDNKNYQKFEENKSFENRKIPDLFSIPSPLNDE